MVIMEIKSEARIFILKRTAAKNQSYPWMNPALTEPPGPRSWPSGSNIQDFLATTAWYPKKLTLVQPSWMATLCAAKGNQGHISVRQASQMPQITSEAEVLDSQITKFWYFGK